VDDDTPPAGRGSGRHDLERGDTHPGMGYSLSGINQESREPKPRIQPYCSAAMGIGAGDHKPHSWVRSLLIGLAVFAGWLVVAVTTYQEPRRQANDCGAFSK
jgi:hypothetical protein